MLDNIPLFFGLDDEEREVLERLCTTRNFAKKAAVITKGEPADALYIIISGKVEIFIADEKGREVVLNTQGPGEHFGELALLGGMERTASVAAVEDTMCLVLSKDVFMQFLNSKPNIALNLIKGLVERVAALSENVSSLALLDTYGRITKLLLENAVQEGDMLVAEKLTQQDIANRIGSSREMVNRIIRSLKEGGYISTRGRHIIIHKQLPARW